ncbi:NmrA domain-containing protein [Mycena venus]|uniref:NmrA domain-containing protein n=1 Tax=Mycena venus TaxID=2733690 RepID=A0A8H6WXS9_9AGAR|nr:NmrA domain-containing protein [Mycena venus]
MSTYKSFAVVGAGTMGVPIINALAAKNATVVALSRPGSSAKTLPSDVQVVQVDFSDAAAVAAVLKAHEVDVVFSTISDMPASFATHRLIVDAAKLAAVKLFVPSEYGFPTEGLTQGPLAFKNELAGENNLNLSSTARKLDRLFASLLEICQSSLNADLCVLWIMNWFCVAKHLSLLQNGAFTEWIPWLVDYSSGGKFKVVGKGEASLSFTSLPDIAGVLCCLVESRMLALMNKRGLVAHVLTTLPPPELENRILRVEGERATLRDVAAQFQTSIEHVDSITGELGEGKTRLRKLADAGGGSTGWDWMMNKEGNRKQCGGECERVVAGTPVAEH